MTYFSETVSLPVPTGHSLHSGHTGLQADDPSSSRSALTSGFPLIHLAPSLTSPSLSPSQEALHDCEKLHCFQHHLALFPDLFSSTASIFT